MAKLRVALIFGGVSSEHEISCISGAAIAENLDSSKYDLFKIGITKKGRWLMYPGGPEGMRDGSWETCPDAVPAFISPDALTRGIVTCHDATFDVVKIDVVFPALHGKFGEDGTLQGLLDLAGIPYVGCNTLASALCMDKASTNTVFDMNGVPHTPWVAISRQDLDDFEKLLFRLKEKLNFPIFVKPSAAGSSIGVTKVTNEEDLRSAILLAGAHDRTIVLEQAVVGKEVECAVLGNYDPIASLPGEIVSCNEVYDYEAKYQSGDASKLYIPARLPAEKLEEVREMALRAYKTLGCTGLSRVDFFVEEETGRVLINEINTLPGFTSISMYPKLMECCGFAFPDLMDQLITLAQERAEA